MVLSRLMSIIERADSLLMPPFRGGHIVAWVCVLIAGICSSSAPIWQGDLADPDNYLYLIQAVDWLNGQSWFDVVQHRINPPDGTYIHYSHYLSGLYAAFIFILKPLLGTILASLIVAAFFPLVFLGAFLLLMRRLAQVLVDRDWGDFTGYLILFSIYIVSRFMPGYVDHHGLVLLLVMGGFYGVVRMVLRPRSFGWAALGGAALALAMALALESLATILLLCACLGAWAVAEGRLAARSSLVFSLSLFVSSFFLLLGVRPLTALFDIQILAYSIVYVILMASIALCFAGVALVGRYASLFWRVVSGAVLGSVGALVFLGFFPELAAGPYGGMDLDLARLIFGVASEARPLLEKGPMSSESIATAFIALLLPSLSFLGGLHLFFRAKKKERRWLWGMVLFMMAGTAMLAIVYQCRFLIYVEAFGLLGLTGMTARWCGRKAAAEPCSGPKVSVGAFVFLAIAFGLMFFRVVWAGVEVARRTSINPADQISYSPRGCDPYALGRVLSDEAGYGQRPLTIVNTIFEGTQLLFVSPHKVLAAPYHMNVNGNLDAQRFFSVPDPDDAKKIAERRKIDLIVLCKQPSQLKAYSPDKVGIDTTEPPFIQQLISGKPPDWAVSVPSPAFEDFLLFEVRLFDAPDPSVISEPHRLF